MGEIGLGKIFRSFSKSLGAALLMGAVALIISLQGEWQQSGVTPEKIALLGGAIVAAIAVYGVTSFFLVARNCSLLWRASGKGSSFRSDDYSVFDSYGFLFISKGGGWVSFID